MAKKLASITGQAYILVAAMGRPKATTADMVKEGVIVIDIGMNRSGPHDGSHAGI